MTANEAREPVEGDGCAVAGLGGRGEGYAVRQLRRLLGATAFGVSATVIRRDR